MQKMQLKKYKKTENCTHSLADADAQTSHPTQFLRPHFDSQCSSNVFNIKVLHRFYQRFHLYTAIGCKFVPLCNSVQDMISVCLSCPLWTPPGPLVPPSSAPMTPTPLTLFSLCISSYSFCLPCTSSALPLNNDHQLQAQFPDNGFIVIGQSGQQKARISQHDTYISLNWPLGRFSL